ncbi:hypothetical protein C8J56DRAFT_582535 [Mycena floridula]|nr:hypothetical protein C8J56DRAFT_582535 [Mycena floridula]
MKKDQPLLSGTTISSSRPLNVKISRSSAYGSFQGRVPSEKMVVLSGLIRVGPGQKFASHICFSLHFPPYWQSGIPNHHHSSPSITRSLPNTRPSLGLQIACSESARCPQIRQTAVRRSHLRDFVFRFRTVFLLIAQHALHDARSLLVSTTTSSDNCRSRSVHVLSKLCRSRSQPIMILVQSAHAQSHYHNAGDFAHYSVGQTPLRLLGCTSKSRPEQAQDEGQAKVPSASLNQGHQESRGLCGAYTVGGEVDLETRDAMRWI